MEAVGVFPSAGGPTLGVRNHLEVIAHFTDGGFGLKTRETNFPSIVEHKDMGDWPLKEYRGIPFVYCAPPCAPFSSLGKRGDHWKEDERLARGWAAHNLGLAIKPTIHLFESVPQFFKQAKEIVVDFEKDWMAAGYSVTHFFTGAIAHNLPQRRFRWHLIAHKVELVFPPPQSHVTTIAQAFKEYGPWTDMTQMGHSQRLESLLPFVLPGQNLRKVYMHLAGIHDRKERGLWRYIPGMSLIRLRWDGHSRAVTGAPRQFLPEEDRLVNVGEQAAICGFPPTHQFIGSPKDRYAQIGKGILPPLGDYLGLVAKLSLQQNKRIRHPRLDVVDFRPLAMKHVYANSRIPRMIPALWATMPQLKVPK